MLSSSNNTFGTSEVLDDRSRPKTFMWTFDTDRSQGTTAWSAEFGTSLVEANPVMADPRAPGGMTKGGAPRFPFWVIQVMQINMPWSFNLIAAEYNNNALPMRVRNMTTGITVDYPNNVLPDGNYSVTALQETIEKTLIGLLYTSIIPTFTPTANSSKIQYGVVYRDTTTPGDAYEITLYFNLASQDVQDFTGTRSPMVFNTTGVFATGEDAMNAWFVRSIAVKSQDMSPVDSYVKPIGTLKPFPSNVLFQIPLYINYPGVLVLGAKDIPPFLVNMNTSENFQLYLTTIDSDKPLRLTRPWTMQLQMTPVFTTNTTQLARSNQLEEIIMRATLRTAQYLQNSQATDALSSDVLEATRAIFQQHDAELSAAAADELGELDVSPVA